MCANDGVNEEGHYLAKSTGGGGMCMTVLVKAGGRMAHIARDANHPPLSRSSRPTPRTTMAALRAQRTCHTKTSRASLVATKRAEPCAKPVLLTIRSRALYHWEGSNAGTGAGSARLGRDKNPQSRVEGLVGAH